MSRQPLNRWWINLLVVGALVVGCQAAPDTAATDEPEADGIFALQQQLDQAAESGAASTQVAALQEAVDDGEEATQEPNGPAQQQERMIIKNGAIMLMVDDADSALARVMQVAGDSDGYVISSEVYGDDDTKSATVTIAVRADQFEAAMERLRGIAIEVLSESATGQDVTGEFVDLESRLRTLEATRARIQGFLDQAQTVEEALDVNRELTSIDEEIETVRGRMKYLSGRAAFSTITVQIRLDPPEEEAAAPFSAAETLNQAIKAQAAIVQGLIQLLIWLVIVPGPYLVIGGLVFAGVRLWSKRRAP